MNRASWTKSSLTGSSWLTSAGAVLPVETPPVDFDLAYAYFDAQTPFIGTDDGVVMVMTRGVGGVELASAGSDSFIQHTSDGFVFSDGRWLQTPANLGPSTENGWFGVVAITPHSYGSNTGTALELTSGSLTLIRNTNNSWQYIMNHASSNASVNSDAVVYGEKIVLGAKYDPATTETTLLLPDGTFQVLVSDATATIFNQIRVGRFSNATVHRQAVFTHPAGGNLADTFERVIDDFKA
jgi:hypothetical protein